jgi:hypothetical protein
MSARPHILRRTHRGALPALAAALTVACATAAVSSAATAAASTPVPGVQSGMVRIGAAPRLPAGASPAGVVDANSTVHVTVALTPRNPSALAAYAQGVSTPGSPDYHDYLTVSQFAQRFGATPQQQATVADSLRAEGLSPGAASPNGLSLDITATAGTLQSALETKLERYTVPGGHRVFANTAPPAVPAPAEPLIQGIVGLDSASTPTPSGLVKRRAARVMLRSHVLTRSQSAAPGESAACPQAADSGGYTAQQIAGAYGFSGLYGAGDGGAGQTIALFELEPYDSADVQAYQSCYGTSAPVSTVAVDGGAGSGSGSGEAALDIEEVIGLAPKASVLVYEGPNAGNGAYDTYSAMVTQDRAHVISTSWGMCEAQQWSGALQAENTLFQEAAAQGQSVFAAAGDSGADDCGSGAGAAVDDPASQPYVTGVGGTTMHPTPTSPTESVWNSSWGGVSGAGGGGASSVWGMPSYQSGIVAPQVATACGASQTSCREVPDVTADADVNTGYAIVYQGGWSEFGGTSAAVPTWAALAALADGWSGCTAPIGFANPGLYAAAQHAYSATFNDVTSGNNSFDGVSGFAAGPGYDMASGLGSPKGSALAAALCGAPPPSAQTPGTTSQPPAGSTTTAATGAPSTTTAVPTVPVPPPAPVVSVALPTVGGSVGRRLRVVPRAHDGAGLALAWRATGLPGGLSINSSTGVISGTPTRAARGTVTVSAVDRLGGSGSATALWTIVGRARITSAVRYRSSRRALLTIEARAGQFTGGIDRIVIAARGGLVRFSRAVGVSAFLPSARGGGARRLWPRLRLVRGMLVLTMDHPVALIDLRLVAPFTARWRPFTASTAALTRWAPRLLVSVS